MSVLARGGLPVAMRLLFTHLVQEMVKEFWS